MSLQKWKDRLEKAISAYTATMRRMDEREEIYNGKRTITPTTENDRMDDGSAREAANVWNIVAENIEAMVDSSIPMPKVSALRPQDEELASKIESMLRCEIDRLPMEKINDLVERICKKQGGVFMLPEWDSTEKSHCSDGANRLTVIHPRRVVPQPGIELMEDADYIFVRTPMTKEAVRQRYGVDVKDESEEDSSLRDGQTADDLVTVNQSYYRNDKGGVGRYTWVNDTELEDLEDCQARVLRKCAKCGQTEITNAMTIETTMDGTYPDEPKPRKPRRDQCSYCGSRKWETTTEEERELDAQQLAEFGVREDVLMRLVTAGMQGTEDGDGAVMAQMLDQGMIPPVTVPVPYFKPTRFPVVLQNNISRHSSLLGESDIDAVADQQNALNRMQQKVLDKLVTAGSLIVLPPDSQIKVTGNDQRFYVVKGLTDLTLMRQFDLEGNIQQDMAYLAEVYQQSQRRLGITESFLGRRDATATSGTAKEFAAAQTAGRMESRRVLKKLAWSEVYRQLFENMVAYADERRPLHRRTEDGAKEYFEWNAWEFLDVDEAGELYWNTEFLFDCDDASGLANNREAMWRETTAHLQSGAYGDPASLDTLLIYWGQMEVLHYPGAKEAKAQLQARQQREMERAMRMQKMQLQMEAQQKAQQQQLQSIPAGMTEETVAAGNDQMPMMGGNQYGV